MPNSLGCEVHPGRIGRRARGERGSQAASAMDRALVGALAGIAGTVAMTAVMRALHRRLPPGQRYPLPPREIIEGSLPDPVKHETGEQGRRTATLAAHFGYGAAAGAIYALAAPKDGLAGGALYGVMVWAGSYFLEMPGLGILEPAHRHPLERNLLMIGAHLVWGGTLGLAVRELQLAEREIFATDVAPDRREPHPP
jgi:uncharacterized membrane protein YagU involved in acid resistance